MEERLFTRIDGYRDYAIELQRGLTAIPAISPASGGEGELDKAVWLEAELRKLRFDEIVRIDAPDERAKGGVRPNIVARYRGRPAGGRATHGAGGEQPRRTLWIMSHLDVVPPGERSLWKSDPYELRVEGDMLYGRGVEDNQQGLVSSILAVRALMDLGIRPAVDVALLLNADEENGSDYGANWIVKNHAGLFGARDMFIVPDAGDAKATMVEVAEKSLLWLKITAHGKQCHASMPHQGRNALRAGSELVVRLGALYRTFNRKNKLYDPPISTFEPTKKDANVPNINTIPAEDVFYLDCRVLPEYKLARVKAEIRRIAREVAAKHKVRFSFESVQESPAAPPTAPDAEIAQLVMEGIRLVHKGKPKPMGIGGGTVATCFRRIRLPAVVYSRQDETAHQPNESCNLNYLIGDAKVFAYAATKSV